MRRDVVDGGRGGVRRHHGRQDDKQRHDGDDHQRQDPTECMLQHDCSPFCAFLLTSIWPIAGDHAGAGNVCGWYMLVLVQAQ